MSSTWPVSRRFRGRGIYSVCALGFLILLPVFSNGRDAFAQWDVEVTVGAGVDYNDNIDLLPSESDLEEDVAGEGLESEEQEVPEDVIRELSRDDTIYTGIAGLAVAWSERDDSLRLNYLGEYRDYQEAVRGEGWYHYLDAALQWWRLDPFRLEVTDTFDYTPRFITRPEADIRNQIQHNVLAIRPSIFWNVDRTISLEASYSHVRETYPGDDVVISESDEDGDGPVFLENDEIFSNTARLELAKRWSPRRENTLYVEGGIVERSLGEDYDILQLGVSGLHRLSPRTALEYDLALEQRWFKNEDGAGDEVGMELAEEVEGLAELEQSRDDSPQALMGDVSLQWHHHEKGTLELSLGQYAEDRYDGETILRTPARAEEQWEFAGGSTISAGISFEYLDYRIRPRKDTIWGPYFHMHWVIVRWVAFDLSGDWRATRIEDDSVLEVREEVIEDDLSQVRAEVIFSLGSRVQLEAAYRYLDNGSNVDLRSYQQNLFSLLLTGAM